MSYQTLLANDDFAALIEKFNANFAGLTSLRRVAKSSAFTVWAGDSGGDTEDYYACTGTFAATLPAANSTDAAAGRVVRIKNLATAAGTITVTSAGSDTIEDGASTTMPLSPGDSVTLVSDGTSNWEII